MTVNRILWNKGRESVDEIVLHDVVFHIEQMSDNSYWIGLTLADGTDLSLNIGAARAPVCLTVQEDDVVWDQVDEHG